MNNEERFIWLNGDIIPISEAKINVLSPTSQFGANVFEGIRCYWNADQHELYAFKLAEHYKRLKNSIKMFRLSDKYSEAEMQQGLVDVIRANNYKEDIAVRQTVFIDGFGSWMAKEPVGMFIAPIPKSRIHDPEFGINCCVSSWKRISDENMSPKVKVGANYINSRMAQIEALGNGYDSAIFMNHRGTIAEGPGSCLCIIRDGVLITPDLTSSILESITRMTILELAHNELGWQCEERAIDRTELYVCDEAFLCGSALEITPILSIDKMLINNGKVGNKTNELHELYLEVLTNQNSKYYDWLTPIYAQRNK